MHRCLFLIILMGQCNSSTCQPRVYDFVDKRKNWSDAQSYCRERAGTDLATINDMEDVKLLLLFVDSVDNGPAWIGLEKRGKRLWHWPMLNGTLLDETEAQWNSGEPNNFGGNENCVAMKQNGNWVDVSCNKNYHFICQSQNEFVLSDVKGNWTFAQNHCKKRTNGLLASPKNEEENEEIRKKLMEQLKDKGEATIGLTVFSDPWKWSDGSNTSFKHWQTKFKEHSGQNRICAVTLTDEGKWNARNCSEELPFFCYSELHGCLDGWLQFNGSCFRHFADKQNWSDAEQHCQDLNAHLVSINSQGEQNLVKLLGKLHSDKSDAPTYQWIGLNDKEEESQFNWTDGSSLVYNNWDADQQQSNEMEDCVMIKFTGGKWHDGACHRARSFTCKSRPDNLILIKKNMTWFNAMNYCREEHHDLVSVHNANEQDWVRQRAKMADTPYVWLGMHYSCPLDFWFWLSNQDSCYRNWAPGNGTGSCGMATAVERGGNQSWVSLHHDEKFNFICVRK